MGNYWSAFYTSILTKSSVAKLLELVSGLATKNLNQGRLSKNCVELWADFFSLLLCIWNTYWVASCFLLTWKKERMRERDEGEVFLVFLRNGCDTLAFTSLAWLTLAHKGWVKDWRVKVSFKTLSSSLWSNRNTWRPTHHQRELNIATEFGKLSSLFLYKR